MTQNSFATTRNEAEFLLKVRAIARRGKPKLQIWFYVLANSLWGFEALQAGAHPVDPQMGSDTLKTLNPTFTLVHPLD